jgi:ketosteroid isomerase-like protein
VTPTDEFLEWLSTVHRDAGLALHDGNPEPKLAIWSTTEPMSLFGAFWFEATNADEARNALVRLAEKFSDCTEYSEELVSYGVVGDLAYSVAHECASMRVDGQPQHHVLRVTQVYRREHSSWKVAHRHADDAAGRTVATAR